MDADQRAALAEYLSFIWEQDGVDFSDTAALCLRMVAQVLGRRRDGRLPLAEAALPYELLIQAPLDRFYFSYLLVEEEEGVDDKASYAAFLRIKEDPAACAALQRFRTVGRTKAQLATATATMLASIFAMDEVERTFFSAARVSAYMGAALLNAQDRSTPSPYEHLKDTLEYIPEVAEKVKGWEKKWWRKNSKAKATALLAALDCSSGGQGIYTVGCLFNHSCDPTCK
ncbi:SET and MYND domain-containing protein [Strigomonas culicis]|uniref:SET and MYND domain-containing protein n=1 Tax=Strigomonas culicis TaxID=28005 RepID=S9TQ61_9TRYP|nr:SET and MYND domain-containing protein [Strigomonas culicis]|eukprot:EPY18794.1 SET and MYND domain-containing protein [Strigomonas culicis]